MVIQNETARPRGTDSARVIQVIETKSLAGRGTEDDVCRITTQYWSLDGELLAVGISDHEMMEVSTLRLAEIRKERGFTQKELAKAIGVDQTAVHQWESGKTSPRVRHLKAIARVLGCTINDIYENNNLQ